MCAVRVCSLVACLFATTLVVGGRSCDLCLHAERNTSEFRCGFFIRDCADAELLALIVHAAVARGLLRDLMRDLALPVLLLIYISAAGGVAGSLRAWCKRVTTHASADLILAFAAGRMHLCLGLVRALRLHRCLLVCAWSRRIAAPAAALPLLMIFIALPVRFSSGLSSSSSSSSYAAAAASGGDGSKRQRAQ